MASPNKTRVQVATDPAFSNVVFDESGTYTTELLIAENVLPKGINLYTRGMHGHPITGDSNWSTTIQFQIKLAWADWDGSINGLEYTLNSSQSFYISSVTLSENKVLVCYRNNSHGNYLYSVIVTIVGSTLTVGTPVQCNSTITDFISAVALSDTKVMVVYRNGSNSNYPHGIILDIAGDSITPGISVQIGGGVTYTLCLVRLSTIKAVITYANNSNGNYLYAAVLSVSGAVITVGPRVQCNSSLSVYVSAVALSEDKILMAYRNDTIYSYLYTVVLTIDGTNILVGPNTVCNNVISNWISVVALSSTKAVVCYCNGTDGNKINVNILTINGTSINPGSRTIVDYNSASWLSAVLLSEDKVLICYDNTNNDRHLTAVLLTITGTTVVADGPVECGTTSIQNTWYGISATKASENKVFVTYARTSDKFLCGEVLVG